MRRSLEFDLIVVGILASLALTFLGNSPLQFS
jgi:hypothetical protein